MDVWNFALIFVLFAGHCELMAAWINRLHAWPIPHPLLKASQRFHDLTLLGFWPYVLFKYWEPFTSESVGSLWHAFSHTDASYFALCGLGVVSLMTCSIRYCTRQPEPITQTRTIKVRNEQGKPPVGEGLKGWIAGRPANEVTRFEWNDKQLVIRRLPHELAGVTIAHISDVHFYGPIALPFFQEVFEKVSAMNADLVCFTGDLIDRIDKLDWIESTFRQLSAPLGCYFILGNHDADFPDAPTRSILTELGWHDVSQENHLIRHQEKTIWIGGDETPWSGRPFTMQQSDDAGLRLLLSHAPDHFPRAARENIDLVLSGHTHGGQVCLPIIGPVYAPSRFGIRYAGGTFKSRLTTLHVSRGVSAKRPLRWNCPPEISRLTLVPEAVVKE